MALKGNEFDIFSTVSLSYKMAMGPLKRAVLAAFCIGASVESVYCKEVNYAVSFTDVAPYAAPSDHVDIYDIGGYRCMMPIVEVGEEVEQVNLKTQYELEMEKTQAIESIVQFNRHWQDKLKYITLHHGYWHFTLMFNNSLHQTHFEDEQHINADGQPVHFKSMVASYTLFKVDGLYSDSDFELMTLDSGLKYVTQNIGAGQECDLTGLPRSTIINYMCNPQAKIPLLTKVDEWRTCAYMATLESDWFCHNNSSAWSPELVSQQVSLTCVLHEHILNDQTEQFVPPLDVSKYKYSPVHSGVLLGRPKNESDVSIILLTKDFNIYNFSLDESGTNQSLDIFLEHLGLGFDRLIKRAQMENPLGRPVAKTDTLAYSLPLYDMTRTIIGSVLIEQKEGKIATYMTNDIHLSYEDGNWDFYSNGDTSLAENL